MPDELHKLAECMNDSHYKNVTSAPLSHQKPAPLSHQKTPPEVTEVVVERSRNQNGGGDE